MLFGVYFIFLLGYTRQFSYIYLILRRQIYFLFILPNHHSKLNLYIVNLPHPTPLAQCLGESSQQMTLLPNRHEKTGHKSGRPITKTNLISFPSSSDKMQSLHCAAHYIHRTCLRTSKILPFVLLTLHPYFLQ